jgi:hypothetical protein
MRRLDLRNLKQSPLVELTVSDCFLRFVKASAVPGGFFLSTARPADS